MARQPVLRPAPGFNSTAVSWRGPDEPASEVCSYCDAGIPEDDVPLILWNRDGWCARFCHDCQRRWWGLSAC